MVEKVKLMLLCMQRYSWEQGVTMQAFLEAGDMETVIALAKEAVHRQSADGRAADIGGQRAVTDPCSVGEALIAACNETNDAELKSGLDKLIEWAINEAPRSKEGLLYHMDYSCQFWADSLYMLPPFLAAAGYYQEALTNYYGYWEKLRDSETKMLSHMWDETTGKFERKAHWGVGNGWALAAGVRMIRLLPAEYEADKNRIKQMTEELVATVLKWVRPDGYFYDVIDDNDTFVETNLTQMVAYTLYAGMVDGWLTKDYKEKAEHLYEAAKAKVDNYGLVQDVCGAPTFDKAGVASEGQAFFILMESARKNFYIIM